jgi:glutamate--cysteine ligase
MNDYKKISLKDLSENEKSLMASGKIGLERECFRINENNIISKRRHHESLGSALCNKYITTDFSEALLEFVTPPLYSNKSSLEFLQDIHHFVTKSIGNERLWPLSMPPSFQKEADIPIAYYGKSNLGRFKRTYREGLSIRYGRPMQAIAGIHYNYSLPNDIWDWDILKNKEKNKKEIRSDVYFRIIRNLHSFNWLLLYFFGSSPIVNKEFIKNRLDGFVSYKDSFYSPYATSLRMSHLGYQNINQSKLHISINNIYEYIDTLRKATKTKSSKFSNLSYCDDNPLPQINGNILQIEDEYYASSRPKNSFDSQERNTSKLKKYGVNYIELRSLDINPFSRTGIDENTMIFLEVFMIFSAFESSPKLSKNDMLEIKENDKSVAFNGRKPGVELSKDGKKIKLRDWANEILDSMSPYFELLSVNPSCLKFFRSQVSNPDTTISAKLLENIFSEDGGLNEFGLNIASKNNDFFMGLENSDNKIWTLLKTEANESYNKQNDIENRVSEKESFKKYLDNYLSN